MCVNTSSGDKCVAELTATQDCGANGTKVTLNDNGRDMHFCVCTPPYGGERCQLKCPYTYEDPSTGEQHMHNPGDGSYDDRHDNAKRVCGNMTSGGGELRGVCVSEGASTSDDGSQAGTCA